MLLVFPGGCKTSTFINKPPVKKDTLFVEKIKMANHYSNIDTDHQRGNTDPESFHYALTSADSANPEVSRKYQTSLKELWDKFQKKEDVKVKQKLFKLLIIRLAKDAKDLKYTGVQSPVDDPLSMEVYSNLDKNFQKLWGSEDDIKQIDIKKDRLFCCIVNGLGTVHAQFKQIDKSSYYFNIIINAVNAKIRDGDLSLVNQTINDIYGEHVTVLKANSKDLTECKKNVLPFYKCITKDLKVPNRALVYMLVNKFSVMYDCEMYQEALSCLYDSKEVNDGGEVARDIQIKYHIGKGKHIHV